MSRTKRHGGRRGREEGSAFGGWWGSSSRSAGKLPRMGTLNARHRFPSSRKEDPHHPPKATPASSSGRMRSNHRNGPSPPRCSPRLHGPWPARSPAGRHHPAAAGNPRQLPGTAVARKPLAECRPPRDRGGLMFPCEAVSRLSGSGSPPGPRRQSPENPSIVPNPCRYPGKTEILRGRTPSGLRPGVRVFLKRYGSDRQRTCQCPDSRRRR